MKTKFILLAGLATGLSLQLCSIAVADTLWTATGSSGALNELIPDGNLSGLSSSMTLSSLAAQQITAITSVQVTVDVTGAPNAWDSDYYAYLEYDGTLVVLLNQLDVTVSHPWGSPGNGFDITFSAAGPSLPANAYTTAAINGTYQPVGNLNAFDNSPNTPGGPPGGIGAATTGAWTLFIADESPGGVGKLAGWSLAVTGVPDGGSTLLLLGMGFSLLGLCSMRQRHARLFANILQAER